MLLGLLAVASAHVPHDDVLGLAPAPGLAADRPWFVLMPHYDAQELARSDDGGRTWTGTSAPALDDALTDGGTLDDGTVVLLGDHRLWWWSAADDAWTDTSLSFVPTAFATADRVYLGGPDGVYAATADGNVALDEPGGTVSGLWPGAGTVVATFADHSLMLRRDGAWTPLADVPGGVTAATATSDAVYVGTATGSVWRADADGWTACAPSPFDGEDPLRNGIAHLATDGTTLLLANEDIGPAASTDRCATWTADAAPVNIEWIEDGTESWTTPVLAFVGLAVSGTTRVVAGYDGIAVERDGVWTHAPVKNADYARSTVFSRDFETDGLALVPTYGCGIARTQGWGATWDCPGLGLTEPAAQDVEVPVDAVGLVPAFALSDRIPQRSDDGGRTWTALTGPWRKVWRLDVGPTGRLWAVAMDQDPAVWPGDLAVTLDGGTTWTTVPGLSVTGDAAVRGVFDTGDLVGAWTTTALFLSTDGATTFSNVGELGASVMDAEPWPRDAPSRVVVATTEDLRILEDGDWRTVTLPGAPHLYRMAQADDGTLYVATFTHTVLRSDDGGDTWTDLGVTLPSQAEALDPSPDTRWGELVVATGDGVFGVDADGTLTRWMGYQQVDDSSEFVMVDPAGVATEDTTAALSTAQEVGAGAVVTTWLRGTTVRALGAVGTAATVELDVDGVTAATALLGPLAMGSTLVEAGGLADTTTHEVVLRVLDGTLTLDAFAADADHVALDVGQPPDTGDSGTGGGGDSGGGGAGGGAGGGSDSGGTGTGGGGGTGEPGDCGCAATTTRTGTPTLAGFLPGVLVAIGVGRRRGRPTAEPEVPTRRLTTGTRPVRCATIIWNRRCA